ncbi:MAG: ABC transporter substrate-binding protein [Ramlibacter sp.]|nr:ABC transporter substrate-binding protein [Ramlibacter sp.]
MKFTRTFIQLAAATLLAGGASHAAEDGPVKVAVLTDLSGYLAQALGPGSVDAARMAIEDFGGQALGKNIELVFADHQNKPDVGLATARKWYESDGVDVIADIGNSAVGMGVQELAKNKKKLVFFAGASSSAFTGSACSPYGTQWSHDSYMFSKALPSRLVSKGDKNWYIIAADFAFGQALAADTARAVTGAGGKVTGTIKHAPNTSDFSSYLMQASASKADAVALSNGTQYTVNAIKQWNEYQMGAKGQKLIALALLISEVRALGLPTAQGTMFSTVWYWDLNDKTRAFANRFYERNKAMPTEAHAGTYSAVSHYLKAVKAAGTKDPDVVRAKMREIPVNDFYSDNVRIREDGRVMRQSYIAQVKRPAESKGPWDVYKILEMVPAEQSWKPLFESDCPLVKKAG